MVKGPLNGPKLFRQACAVVMFNIEIWLIGDDRLIQSFNPMYLTFHTLFCAFNSPRYGHSCNINPGTQRILITGGFNGGTLDTTEIIDIPTLSVTNAAQMKSKRYEHGMGIMTIDGEEKVVAFGVEFGNGVFVDLFEVYHANTNSWELLNINLSEGKNHFGYVTIKEGDI